MNEKLLPLSDSIIENKIYTIHGLKVMLDKDLAALFNIETKRLKEQVKRNMERFPEHFMFELTVAEHESLRSQFATLKRGQHSKYLPIAFTEHGVLMLSNVLKSQSAIGMSIKIIEVFVKLREVVFANQELLIKLQKIEKHIISHGHGLKQHDEEIKIIFELIDELRKDKQKSNKRQPIGFKIAEKKK
jgi:hypothetical protein